MKSNRENFPDRIKRITGERAAYLCSNPSCRSLTIAPHTDPERSATSGVAAHIAAASPGGPRYSSRQTADERRSIENAIWLCHTCSDLIDKDPIEYSSETLRQWKCNHEDFVARKGMVPKAPRLILRSSNALSLLKEVRAKDCEDYREHVLSISNVGDIPLQNLRLHLRLPEHVVQLAVPQPTGVRVNGERYRIELPIEVKGEGAVIYSPATLNVSNCLRFFVGKIDPEETLAFRWISKGKLESAVFSDGVGEKDGRRWLYHFIRGRYHFNYLQAMIPSTFWYALTYEPSSRQLGLGARLTEEELEEVQVANPRPSATGEYWG
jgi:hypothetical protein